ncbi:MAG: outer membrane protein transport protein, partial [Kordiimonadaceae bacterium]|nr:outer membrane protein transport protein [Kordiimonadaceae bacterium]
MKTKNKQSDTEKNRPRLPVIPHSHPGWKVITFTALISSFGTATQATGFRFLEQSVAQVGNANAGFSALAENATTAITNPAGLVKLGGSGYSISGILVDYSLNFSNNGSASPFGPYQGTANPKVKTLGGLPSFSGYMTINKDLAFGIGIFAPYGLQIDYPDDWIGRYQSNLGKAFSLEINPVVSYRLSEKLSIGGGISAQYFNTKLTSAVDFGGLCFVAVDPTLCSQLGVTPQSADGTSKLTGDAWSFGFNLGLQYEITPGTDIGLTYRSAMTQNLNGSFSFDNPELPEPIAGITQTPLTTGSNLSGEFKLPQMISISFKHSVSSKVSVLGDVTWLDWSRLNSLDIQRDNGTPDVILDFNWRDSFKLALGLNYRASERWLYRFGINYVFNTDRKSNRLAIFPDEDRRTIAAGFNYKFSDKNSIDFAFSFIANKDSDIASSGSDGGQLIGTYKATTRIFALQFNHKF